MTVEKRLQVIQDRSSGVGEGRVGVLGANRKNHVAGAKPSGSGRGICMGFWERERFGLPRRKLLSLAVAGE